MKKRIPLLLTIILCLGISLGAVYFMYYKRDERLSNLTTGLIKLDFQEKSNVIDLDNEVPVPDTVGVLKTPYTFTIKNISTLAINANIKVDVKDNTNIPLGAVRYAVYINDELVKKDYIHDDKILYTFEELLVDESVECKLRFWIDYYYDQPNKEFEALIQIEGESRDTGSEGITVTFDANGGTVDTETKEVAVGENYGRLPIPTREGYTFMGWNGKNILNYNSLTTAAINVNIQVDGNGYISDSTPDTDTRSWSYGTSNYNAILSAGIYTLHLIFQTKTLNDDGREYSGINIFSDTNEIIYNAGKNGILYNKDNYSLVFSLTEDTHIGIMIKSYDGVYKIQLEEGNKVTEWEPYYVTSSTKVIQNKNHTLKALWEEKDMTAPTLSLSKETYIR